MNISNKVTIEGAEVKIEHESCSNPNLYRDKGIFFESTSKENNTLSKIAFNDNLTIYIYWESFESGAKTLDVLYVPETGVLFAGCGYVTARVCTIRKKLLDLDYVELFWGLARHKDYVLESSGELECSLYSLDGRKIASAPVDPPYEMEVTEEGIKFESIVVGTTWFEVRWQ